MKLRRMLPLIFLAFALSVGGAYVAAHRDRFAVLLQVPLAGVVALLAIGVVFRTSEAMVLRTVVRAFGAGVGAWECILLSWATAYWNLLPVKPGTGALGVYLKRRYGVPYSDFVAYLVAANLLRLGVTGLLGVVFGVALVFAEGLIPLVPAVFVVLLAAVFSVMLVPTRWEYGGPNAVLDGMSRTARAWHRLRAERALMARLGAWRLGQSALGALSIYLCFRLTGLDVGFLAAWTIKLVGSLARFATVVPAQFGVQEALLAGGAAALGVAFADGVVAATLRRAVSLPVVLVVGPLASWAVQRLYGFSAAEGEGPSEAGPVPAEPPKT